MKKILKDKKNEEIIYKIAIKYRDLLIKYLTSWKNRDFKFIKDKKIIVDDIIKIGKELEALPYFKDIFKRMIEEKHGDDNVIDYFYKKSKEYEEQQNAKREKENELRIKMFAQYA